MTDQIETRRWHLGFWVAVGSLLVGAIGVAVPIVLWAIDQERQESERIAREQADIPELQAISSRLENGYAVVSIKNKSSTRPANIVEATFTITDADTLARIVKIHPPPRSDGGAGAMNHVDDLFFKEGFWAGDSFVYCARLGLNVEPGGKATDVRLAVLDSRLRKIQLVGNLSIDYEGAGIGHRMLSFQPGQIPAR